MKHRIRNTCLALMALVMAVALTGCMGNLGRPQETPLLTMPPINTNVPGNTMTPVNTGVPGVNTEDKAGQPNGSAAVVPGVAFDWKNQARQVMDNINRLSEISKSYVVVDGTEAVVGVEFANQYKGELTKRIRDMIASQITAADSNIKTVAVTADPGNVQSLANIADRVIAGEDVTQFKAELDTIKNSASTIR